MYHNVKQIANASRLSRSDVEQGSPRQEPRPSDNQEVGVDDVTDIKEIALDVDVPYPYDRCHEPSIDASDLRSKARQHEALVLPGPGMIQRSNRDQPSILGKNVLKNRLGGSFRARVDPTWRSRGRL
jgi:hypothetical protein